MTDEKTTYVSIDKLRVGMYVQLDLGWMSHPFPSGNFKLSNARQIETIQALGLSRVRINLAKSDLQTEAGETPASAQAQAMATTVAEAKRDAELARQAHLREMVASQRQIIAQCEVRFTQATTQCSSMLACISSQPQAAKEHGEQLVGDLMAQMTHKGESMIHLLSDGSGDKLALHPVNVTVLSLLLGKSMELASTDLSLLGLAALMHDIGKEQLPARVRSADASHSPVEEKAYRSHVALGVQLGRNMSLPEGVLSAMAQHHEMVDGSGFPKGQKGGDMSQIGSVLALVNRYDNLCNPANVALALTPHEALAQLFAQSKNKFDPVCLNAFVRLMGVYPPGSLVQLTDDRYGLVMTVNSSRPLRPHVVLYDAAVPKADALAVDLETLPQLGIKRSLKPIQLPQEVASYLSPRKRVSYFFDQASAGLDEMEES